MRILLVGEYSGLHNTLKVGLIRLGHEVTIIGTGDGFKNYPTDITIKSVFLSNSVLNYMAKGFDKLFNINLIQLEYAYRFKKALPQLRDYDVVQLINENSFKTSPKYEIQLLKGLIKQNKCLFLLSCGTDHMSVKFANEKKFRYSILTPLHEDHTLKKDYKFILNYLSKPYEKLHNFLYKNANGIIASDLDYHLPLMEEPKYLGLIPNPINLKKLNFELLKIEDKIHIFHGINRTNYIKKGNKYFEKALEIIEDKYADKIHVVATEDLAYKEYIKAYDGSHILLDQVYAYDQGFNALEAMAKGKVVFTGAEKEWLDHYNLKEDTIAINALPDVNHIVEKLEWLIQNPWKILEISKNARAFIELEHDYLKITETYLKSWKC